MSNIEDRVVSMDFQSTKFQHGIAQSMTSMDKFNAALKNIGANNGLDQIEKSANKINFLGLGTAIDKLKAKFGRGIPEATDAFSDVEKASGKVGFLGISNALDKLRGKFGHVPDDAAQAFSGVEKVSGRVTFSGLSDALSGITKQFSVMQGAASVALGNVVSQAAMRGGELTKSLSFGPIIEGFREYELKLGSIQTILSNTKAAGTTLKDVNKTLQELNHYADKTIYNFGQMTKNIGTFTAAGVDLETATGSIKGIANLAALSGSNAQQASTAMYQLSQAISSGRVSLQDWNSVVNAGMGGTVFQRALTQTAVAMGEIDEGAVKLVGKMKNVKIEGQSFRESIMAKPGEQSWLTGEVLTNTLQQLSGDLSKAELKAQGFSDAQIKAIQKQAKMAVDAATQVKTLSQLMDTTKESITSGWAETWEILFGNFGEAKTLFTGISEAIGDFVGENAKARNKVLEDWKELGGRKDLISGIKNAFEALASIIRPIKTAFREIFPAKTARDLYELTFRFREFTHSLKLSPETAENVKRIFRGLFAILSIGKQVVSGILGVIGDLISEIGNGSGGILQFAGGIGDLIAAFDAWLKQGDRLKGFFDGLGDVLRQPVRLLGILGDALGSLFDQAPGAGVSGSLGQMSNELKPMAKLAAAASMAWEGFLHILEKIGDMLAPVVDAISSVFDGLGNALEEGLKEQNFDRFFSILQTGLIGGIFLAVKKAIGGGMNFDFGGGFIGAMTESLGVFQKTLVAMQRNIQANTLLQIAAAVGILAASAVALSLIKPDKLSSAMSALAIGFGQLIGAMALITKTGGGMFKTTLQLPIIAASLILLAGAVNVLTIAVFALSRLSWEELAKGLGGVGAMLLMLSLAAKPLSAAGPGMIIAGAGLIPLAIGLNILAGAVAIFGNMDLDTLGKGLGAIALSLLAIGVATRLIPPTILLIGPGLIALGVGINIIAGAIALLGNMGVGTLAKGILAMAVSLNLIALAMWAMPPHTAVMAAGLILVGVAMNTIAAAIGIMGNMDIGTLAKGIGTMAASLIVLAVGLTAMIAALPGAAALLVAAGALAIFAPTLGILGNLNWGTVAKGLAVMAISLATMSIVGSVVAPGLIALGVALSVIGASVFLVGAGVKMLAGGLVTLGKDGGKGVAVVMAALTALVALLPKIIVDFLKGLVNIIAQIAKIAPQVVKSVIKITDSLLTAIIKVAPKFGAAVTAIITAVLKVLAKNAGPVIKAGWTLLLQLLKGLSNNIGRVTTTVAKIVARFLTALASRMPQMVSAGARVLIQFLRGIANNIGKVANAAGDVVKKYLKAIGDQLGKIIKAGAELIIKFIKGVTNNLGKVVNAGGNAIIKFITGIGNKARDVAAAGVDMMIKFINAVVKQSLKLGDAGGRAILNWLRGTRRTIDKYLPDITWEGIRLGFAIVAGIVKGLANLPKKLGEKLISPVKGAFNEAKGFLGISSPSKLFMKLGRYMMDGLVVGIDDRAPRVSEATKRMGVALISGFKRLFGIRSPSTVMKEIGEFVGEGFAEGLYASREDVQMAFEDMQGKINDGLFSLQEDLRAAREKLKNLEDKKKKSKKDKSDIAERTKEIAELKTAIANLKAGRAELVDGLKTEKTTLKDLAAQYSDYTDKIEAAEQALENARQARDDFASQTTEQYAALPDIATTDAQGNPLTPTQQLESYILGLDAQRNAVAAYKTTLAQLKAIGLDNDVYEQLVAQGTGAQAFAQALLEGGPEVVSRINVMEGDIQHHAQELGTNAAQALYQAGVDAAKGVADGLKDGRKGIRDRIDEIAKTIINRLKRKLKIESPSKEMAKLGEFTTAGLAQGLRASSKSVADAASQVGEDALEAMRSSMADISSEMAADLDANPTITPVLDLSQIQAGAKKIGDLTNVAPITADASYGLAGSISDARRALSDEMAETGGVPQIKFEQNNYSPEALSDIEIYRRTNNQLSQAKSALGLP